MKVLLVMAECNPEWPSVPLVGYNWYRHLKELVDLQLVTHTRNRQSLSSHVPEEAVDFIEEPWWAGPLYRAVERVTHFRGINWPLHHILTYPIYEDFNRRVYRRYARAVEDGKFDLVHCMTPITPRYPYHISQACRTIPFLLGPVNGGIPFPRGFRAIAFREFGYLNFLRGLGRWLPGYRKTYNRADLILAGSEYTLKHIAESFDKSDQQLRLLSENGVDSSFFTASGRSASEKFELLFVGRLVPYKGVDMALESVAGLSSETLSKIRLRIAGDGPERTKLESLARRLEITDKVQFLGKIPQSETAHLYRTSHAFCFPSVKEFGGAVVLEAMACGLPQIVVNYGGIGEYATSRTGLLIEPTNRAGVIQGLSESIEILARDPELRERLARGSITRAREYEWGNKAQTLVSHYRALVRQKPRIP